MTIGTSMCAPSPPHTPAPPTRFAWDRKRPTTSDDTENRGSYRCGFYFGFYPALHHVSIEHEWPPAPVLIALQAYQLRHRSPHRLPECSPPLRLCPAVVKLLL